MTDKPDERCRHLAKYVHTVGTAGHAWCGNCGAIWDGGSVWRTPQGWDWDAPNGDKPWRPPDYFSVEDVKVMVEAMRSRGDLRFKNEPHMRASLPCLTQDELEDLVVHQYRRLQGFTDEDKH